MRLFALIVALAFGGHSLCMAADLSSLIQPLIDLDEIDAENDEVVLLSTADGMADFMSIVNATKNFSKTLSSVEPGHCLGITEAQLSLLGAIEFDPKGAREKDPEKIYQKLLAAMDSESWRPQKLTGYKDRKAFIEAMEHHWTPDNPLRRAIEEYQRTHGIKITQQGDAKIAKGIPQLLGMEFLESDLKNSQKLAEDIAKKIVARTPVPIALIGAGRNSAHAVTVVGYVKRKGETAPDRFLVSDPNFPGKLKIMKTQGEQWAYQETRVTPTVMNSNISEDRAKALAKVFDIKNVPLKSALEVCQKPTDWDQIVDAAKR